MSDEVSADERHVADLRQRRVHSVPKSVLLVVMCT